jgi:phage terminase small subunit
MLTAKERSFIRCLMEGKTQRQAYKESYNAENMKDESIDVEACKLANSPKIAQRLAELQDSLDKAVIMTVQERMEYLTGIVDGSIKQKEVVFEDGNAHEIYRPATISECMKAIDTMNKTDGTYVNKVEANVNTNVSITVELVDDDEC